MRNIDKIKQYIRREFEYDGVNDPLDYITLVEIDNRFIELEKAGNSEYADILKVGDFWVDDEVHGYVFRVEGNDINTVWSNS